MDCLARTYIARNHVDRYIIIIIIYPHNVSTSLFLTAILSSAILLGAILWSSVILSGAILCRAHFRPLEGRVGVFVFL